MEERLQFTESTAYLMNPQPFASSSTGLQLNIGFGANEHGLSAIVSPEERECVCNLRSEH